MSIVPFRGRPFDQGEMPIIIFLDLQVEYIRADRAYGLKNIENCLQNCRSVLEVARKVRLPIAHFRQLRKGLHFNKKTDFSKWIDGFTPIGSDMVFERELPSCYSNKAFANLIDNIDNPKILLLGLTGSKSCLSTIIDAYHRNHQIAFVKDGSATPAIGEMSEGSTHEMIIALIAQFAQIVETKNVVMKIAESQSSERRLVL